MTRATTAPSRPAPAIGVSAAIAMVVTQVVGVGIFLAPAQMVRTLGSAWQALAVWGVMGALSVLGALCYAELATRFPRAGGAYVFLREAFGARTAFIYGWMSLLVVDPGLTAALGIGLAQYLLAALGLPSGLTPYVAVASIGCFGLLTLRGIDASIAMLQWTAAIKLAMVGALVLVAAAGAAGSPAGEALSSAPAPLTPGALAGATIAAFFAFGGWWDVGRMSEEVASPRRTLPAALIGGVGLVTLIYALVTVAFLIGPRAAGAASDEAFVSAAGTALFGEAAGRLLAAGIAIAVAGSLAAVLLGAPRVYLAMTRDGLFPSRAGRFDERRGTLPGATIVQVSLACLLALVGSFDQVLGFFVPAAVFFLGLSAAAVLVLPRPAAHEAVFRAPLHPLPIALFLLLTAAVVALFALGQPVPTLVGAAIVAVGVPVSRRLIPSHPGQR